MMHWFIYDVCASTVALFGRVFLRAFGHVVSSSARIYGFPTVWRMHGTLRIGERVVLSSMPSMYEFGQELPRCVFAGDKGSQITIGDDTCIVGSALFVRDKIIIGKRVLISAGCRIADTNFHPVDMVPRRYEIDRESSPVIIEDDAWLCAEVMVKKGVTIGRGSVIGAKSLVSSDIPPMVFAAGIPAKVIRPLRIDEINSRPPQA